MKTAAPKRIVFWGTYDVGKPRVRLLLDGAKRAGFEVIECHQDVWRGVEDKSQVRQLRHRIARLTRWVIAYPSLLRRYLRLPEHAAVVVAYPGALDVVMLWLVVRFRRVPIVWDVFFSLYDTIVRDRRLMPAWWPPALALYALEWLAARAATRLFLDTRTHAAYFSRLFGCDAGAVGVVPVGTEEETFTTAESDPTAISDEADRATFTVLFYGQFIPLHGLDVVVEAAELVGRETRDVRWVIIGRGQEAARIDARLSASRSANVRRIEWVPYAELSRWIRQADVCLGIFGTSQKAHNVVPNKVYQALAMGRRVVTSDTPAQRELLAYGAAPWLTMVSPGNAKALAEAVLRLSRERRPVTDARVVVGAEEVGLRLRDVLESVLP